MTHVITLSALTRDHKFFECSFSIIMRGCGCVLPLDKDFGSFKCANVTNSQIPQLSPYFPSNIIFLFHIRISQIYYNLIQLTNF